MNAESAGGEMTTRKTKPNSVLKHTASFALPAELANNTEAFPMQTHA
jgi:hypothetical protein